MNNLEKFFEEVYREASKLHLSEVNIAKLMQAVHNDARDGQNVNLRFNTIYSGSMVWRRWNKGIYYRTDYGFCRKL